jgi:hypothetical protein
MLINVAMARTGFENSLFALQNAYVFNGRGDGIITCIPRHRKDLTRYAPCSDLRIPRDADQRSELMSITIPK